jgi:hypothetical protein
MVTVAPAGAERNEELMSKREELERALKHLVDNLKPFPERHERILLLASIDMILDVLTPEADTPDAVPKSWEEERKTLSEENTKLRKQLESQAHDVSEAKAAVDEIQLKWHASRKECIQLRRSLETVAQRNEDQGSGQYSIQKDIRPGFWSHMDFPAVVPQGSPQCLSRKIVLSFPEDCAGQKISVELTKLNPLVNQCPGCSP